MIRSQRLLPALLASSALLAVGTAFAQTYPGKPVRMLVGYAAGGGMDAIARIVGQRLTEQMGQQFLVENRPGAGATLAADAVAKSAPDGYTLYFAETAVLIAPSLYPKLAFDPLKSFAPVAGVATLPLAIVVNPSLNARTPAELIALLRANAGKLSYGSPGVATLQHIAMEMFLRRIGAELIHVPYRGASPMIPDLVSGAVPIGVISVAPALGQARAGKLRTIAITSSSRLGNAPEWPTLAETFAGFDAAPRIFVLAPAGTPDGVISRLNEGIRTAVASKDVVDGLTNQGATGVFAGSRELAAEMQNETRKWSAAVREANVKAD